MKVIRAPWKLGDGRIVDLITRKEFDALPDGTELVCIDGMHVVKGTDEIDDDTSMGLMVFGFLRPPLDMGAFEVEIDEPATGRARQETDRG